MNMLRESPFMRNLVIWGTIGILAAVALFAYATSQLGAPSPGTTPTPSPLPRVSVGATR